MHARPLRPQHLMFGRSSRRRSSGGEQKSSLREALRNRGGAQNVVSHLPSAAESEPETSGLQWNKDPLPARGSAGLDWLNLTAFAPKNLQNVIEKLRIDLQPAVIRRGFDSDAEEVGRLHNQYREGLSSCSESEDGGIDVTSAPSHPPARVNAGRGKPKPKAKPTGLKAALQARGGMQRPLNVDTVSHVFDTAPNTTDGGRAPSPASPLASSPLPSVEEEQEAEAADHEVAADGEAESEVAQQEEAADTGAEEAVQVAAPAEEEWAPQEAAAHSLAAREGAQATPEGARRGDGPATKALANLAATTEAAGQSEPDVTESLATPREVRQAGEDLSDAKAKASAAYVRQHTAVTTNARTEKVSTCDFRVQHFNRPVSKDEVVPLPWKASVKTGEFRRSATVPLSTDDAEDTDKEKVTASPIFKAALDRPIFKENREVPKKLKDLQDFWGKKSVGFAGPALGSNRRLSKGEAQATLQRLIAAGGAVDFDEVRRLRKMIAELE